MADVNPPGAEEGMPLGQKVGIGVGVGVGVIALVAAISTILYLRRRKKAVTHLPHDGSAELQSEAAEPKVYQLSGNPMVPEMDHTTSPGNGEMRLELEGASPVDPIRPHLHDVGDLYPFSASHMGTMQLQGQQPEGGEQGGRGPNVDVYAVGGSAAVTGVHGHGASENTSGALERLRAEKTRLEARRQRLIEIEENEQQQREIQRQIEELERERGS